MEYLVKSTVLLTMFYIFYKVLLQNETFFSSIRTYFIIGILTSLALPYLVITRYVEVETQQLPVGMELIQSSVETGSTGVNWTQLLMVIYFVGVAVFTVRFLIQLGSLLVFLFTHERVKKCKYYLI